MKKRILAGTIAIASLASFALIGCLDNKQTELVDNTVYFKKNIEKSEDDSIEEQEVVAVIDGKEINLGESVNGLVKYNKKTQEYLVFDAIDSKNINIVSVDKNGKKKIVVENVALQVPLGIFEDNNFYYCDQDLKVKSINLDTNEIKDVGDMSNSNGMPISIREKAVVYLKNEVVMIENLKTNEQIEFPVSMEFLLDFKVKDNKFAFVDKDNNIQYVDLNTLDVKSEPLNTDKDVRVLNYENGVLVYTTSEYLDTDLYYKKYDEEPVLIDKVNAIPNIFNDRFIYTVKDGEDVVYKYIDLSSEKESVELIRNQQISTYMVSNKGRVCFAIEGKGVYELKNDKIELIFDSKDKVFIDFDEEKLIVVNENYRDKDRKDLSRRNSFDIYIDGKLKEKDAIWYISLRDNLIYKSKDSKIYTVVEGDVQKIDFDYTSYNTISNKDSFEVVKGYSKSLWVDYLDIEGYWYAEENGKKEYYRFVNDKYRYFGEAEDLRPYVFTEMMTVEGYESYNKMNIYFEDTADISAIERINDDEIKLRGKTLKRISKEQTDAVMKGFMENNQFYLDVAAMELKNSSGVKFVEEVENIGVKYYIVETNDGTEKVAVREDGEVFSYQIFEEYKGEINDKNAAAYWAISSL